MCFSHRYFNIWCLMPSDVMENVKSQICSVRNLMVTHAACGSDHTALLTLDGGVFTFGAGNYGQLGHGGGKNNEQNPKKVLELMGTEVSQVQPTGMLGNCHVYHLD